MTLHVVAFLYYQVWYPRRKCLKIYLLLAQFYNQVWYLRCHVSVALNVVAPAGNNIDVIIWLKNNILNT
jgi:hypothetical protein